ncbi:hypothetical protein BHE74_00059354, partial [Ensete ventricosum]
ARATQALRQVVERQRPTMGDSNPRRPSLKSVGIRETEAKHGQRERSIVERLTSADQLFPLADGRP